MFGESARFRVVSKFNESGPRELCVYATLTKASTNAY